MIIVAIAGCIAVGTDPLHYAFRSAQTVIALADRVPVPVACFHIPGGSANIIVIIVCGNAALGIQRYGKVILAVVDIIY